MIKKKSLLIGILLITFFLEAWAPATSGSTLSSDGFKTVIRITYFALAAVIMVLTFSYGKADLSWSNFIIAMTPMIYLGIHKLWVYSASSGSASTALICILFAIQTKEIKRDVYQWIKRLFVIISLIGIICFVSFTLNLGLPYRTVPYYSSLKHGVWYVDYGVIYFYLSSVQARLCGIFNEPGWFGTFLAFYLCAEDLNMKKAANVIVLIAGILTFSLAFILILAIYAALKCFSDWRKWIWLIMLAGFYIFILPHIRTGNEVIDSFIDRIVMTSESLQSNSRTTDAFDNMFDAFLHSRDILFGMGSGYSETVGGGNLSIKTDFVDFGLIGVLIFYVPIFLLLMYRVRSNKKAVLFLICVAASLYQRPWIFEASNFILTVSCASYLTAPKQEKNHSSWILPRSAPVISDVLCE